MQLDLHGYHLHAAWKKFSHFVDDAYFDNRKAFTVITGQGVMMREMPVWCFNHARVAGCTQHKHNPGSFTVKLKKKG